MTPDTAKKCQQAGCSMTCLGCLIFLLFPVLIVLIAVIATALGG